MRAAPKHKHIHEFLRHDGYFRVSEPSDAALIIAREADFGKVTFVQVRACADY